jgi:hypothetical protein
MAEVDLICRDLLMIPAPLAVTQELKKVALDLKTGLLGQPFLQPTEVTIGEVDHRAALRANQVMMVF